MSVASTRDEDVESAAAHLPDRPISAHPNLVTATGLTKLEEALVLARSAFASAQAEEGIQGDRTAMARAARDLRYLAARRASAQLLEPDKVPGTVAFGSSVEFKRDDGRMQIFRIVGEDEADPASGSISYVSPLAKALLGKKVGEIATLAERELEIIGVDPAPNDPVSFMITRSQKEQLKALGHTDETIRDMKPIKAHKLLSLGRSDVVG